MRDCIYALRHGAAGVLLLVLGSGAALAETECPYTDEKLRTVAGMYVAGVAGFTTSLTEGSRPQALGYLVSRALSEAPEASGTRACVRRIDALLQSSFSEHGQAPLNGYVAGSMGVPPENDPFSALDPAELIAAIEALEAPDTDDGDATIATEWELVRTTLVADGKSNSTEVRPGSMRMSFGENGALYQTMMNEEGGRSGAARGHVAPNGGR